MLPKSGCPLNIVQASFLIKSCTFYDIQLNLCISDSTYLPGLYSLALWFSRIKTYSYLAYTNRCRYGHNRLHHTNHIFFNMLVFLIPFDLLVLFSHLPPWQYKTITLSKAKLTNIKHSEKKIRTCKNTV